MAHFYLAILLLIFEALVFTYATKPIISMSMPQNKFISTPSTSNPLGRDILLTMIVKPHIISEEAVQLVLRNKQVKSVVAISPQSSSLFETSSTTTTNNNKNNKNNFISMLPPWMIVLLFILSMIGFKLICNCHPPQLNQPRPQSQPQPRPHLQALASPPSPPNPPISLSLTLVPNLDSIATLDYGLHPERAIID